MKKRKNKEVRHQYKDVDGAALKLRQRVWAKSKHSEYLNHLLKVGHTFDEQPKELFLN